MHRRPASFYILSVVFALFIAFLYGPMLCIYLLSFQGPEGGMSFPMRGFSFVWFETLFSEGRGVGDLQNSFWRSMVGSSRVDLQACKLEYSIVSPK